jgi:hypothetical protein
MTKYNPEEFLESTTRCLKEYLEHQFDISLNDGGANYVGLDAYEIVAQFPATDLELRRMPMHKTVIHFEIDDIQSTLLGMGDNIFASTYDDATGLVTGRTGEMHVINFDIGVWASDASGGITARSRAKQILQNCLGGALGIKKLRDFTDGGDGTLEILSFSGGRFVLDKINDMTVYRMAECTLILRVYSRAPLDDALIGQAIEDIFIDPKMWIDENGQLQVIE